VQLLGLWWKLNVRREHMRHIAQRRARLAREAAQRSADPAYYERSV
jgi:hypothetical protein